ncbi:MAG TPA: hypothetical protein VIN77_15535 [Aurantimonas sp.]
MHMVIAARGLVFGGALALLAACSPTNSGADLASSAAPPASVAAAQGTEAPYCPNVSLREGTAILTKTVGDDIDFVASVADTTRDCRIVDGKLRMKIGIAGRVTPGPAATNRTVSLPIRIAILNGEDVIYSRLGQTSVPVTRNAGAQTFIYVDEAIAIDPASARSVIIYAGYDEGPAG